MKIKSSIAALAGGIILLTGLACQYDGQGVQDLAVPNTAEREVPPTATPEAIINFNREVFGAEYEKNPRRALLWYSAHRYYQTFTVDEIDIDGKGVSGFLNGEKTLPNLTRYIFDNPDDTLPLNPGDEVSVTCHWGSRSAGSGVFTFTHCQVMEEPPPLEQKFFGE